MGIKRDADKVLQYLYDEYVKGIRFSDLETLESALDLNFDEAENAIDYLVDKKWIFLSFTELGHHNSERQEHGFKFRIESAGVDIIED